MSKLKACPFCGQQIDMDFTNVTAPLFEWDRVELRHTNCLVSIRGYSVEEVIHDWNTRPIEDALRAEIARRDEEVAELRKQKYIPVHDTLTDAGKEYYEKCIRQEKELARRDEIIAGLIALGDALIADEAVFYSQEQAEHYTVVIEEWHALMKEWEEK